MMMFLVSLFVVDYRSASPLHRPPTLTFNRLNSCFNTDVTNELFAAHFYLNHPCLSPCRAVGW